MVGYQLVHAQPPAEPHELRQVAEVLRSHHEHQVQPGPAVFGAVGAEERQVLHDGVIVCQFGDAPVDGGSRGVERDLQRIAVAGPAEQLPEPSFLVGGVGGQLFGRLGVFPVEIGKDLFRFRHQQQLSGAGEQQLLGAPQDGEELRVQPAAVVLEIEEGVLLVARAEDAVGVAGRVYLQENLAGGGRQHRAAGVRFRGVLGRVRRGGAQRAAGGVFALRGAACSRR